MTEGERWAAAELGRLRAARFSPGAWRRFIGASLERAADARAARPALRRQARRWSAAGGLAGLAACRLGPEPCPHVSRFALWWLSVALMLDWHLGMVEGPAGERRERLSTADALTLARVWAVPFLAAAREPAGFTLAVAAAGISDVFDGLLARASGPTRLGRDLDRTADVAIMLAAASGAGRAGWLSGTASRLLWLRGSIPIAVVAGTYFLRDARPTATEFADLRRTTPALIAGLALAPSAPRAGSRLVAFAAAGPLVAIAARVGRQCVDGGRWEQAGERR